jgi:predicted Mrr-cat superfamily restriction endonuclease
LGQEAGSASRFIREIEPGDLVIAPTWVGLNIARVIGPIIFDENLIAEDSAWRYPVNWLRREIPRDSASGALQARFVGRQTCLVATDLIDEIERLSRGEGKPNLEVAIVRSEAAAAIGRVLDQHLTPTDLEYLVMKLVAKSGAHVERPPKNLPNKKGDADVVARHVFPSFTVGYQVKKHYDQSQTGEDAIQQIIDALGDEQLGIDIGCVVTTAPGFTEKAKALAAAAPRGPIRLIARDELIQRILSVGISSLTEAP